MNGDAWDRNSMFPPNNQHSLMSVLAVTKTQAFGREADRINGIMAELRAAQRDSFFLWGPLPEAIADLRALVEVSLADSGESEIEVNRESAEHAVDFLRALPSGAYAPDDMSVDPDGEVSFDWGDGGQRFVVSFSADGLLAFAGIFADERQKGRERFASGVIPQQVLNGIRRTRG